MSFFFDIDNMTILEKNASRVEGMELRQAQRMLKQYRAAANDIKIRMMNTPDNTFSEAKLKTLLNEVNTTISLLKQRVSNDIQMGFNFMHEQGIEDGGNEINRFQKKFAGINNPLPIDAIIESTEPENLLINQFQSSVDAYDARVRSGIQTELTQGLIQGKSWMQVVNDLGGLFTSHEWELARIVRTELHNIYGQSKNNGFLTIRDNYLPDLKKTLYHPMDSRTSDDSLYLVKNPLIEDLDQPFRYKWKGQERVFMTPPDRPNDRSILIPYRGEWNK